MSDNEITIKVKVENAGAHAALEKTRAQARGVGREDPTVKVDADTAGADRKLNRTQREARQVGRVSPTVRVDANIAGFMAKIAAAGAALAALGVAGAGLGAGLGAIGGAGLGALASGFSGVGDAVKQMGKSAAGGGSSAAGAARRLAGANHQVEQSEKELAHAQRDAKHAQEDLNDAREDAKRQLEDLQRRTDDMALTQRQAALDVEQAKQDLDETMADPHATDLMRRQAQLAYEEAVQQQKDLGVEAKRLAEDKAEADKKGVDGSDQVRDAQERVSDAAERVKEAQWQVNDAQNALKESGGGAAGGANALADAMAKLSPVGQKFAKFLRGFIDGPLKEFRFAGQTALLPGIQKGMESLVPVMRQITPQWAAFNKTLGDAVGGLMQHGAKLAEPFLKLASAGLTALAPLGGVIDRFAASFSEMVDKVISDGSLDGAMQGFVDVLDAVLQVLPDLIPVGLQIAQDILPALAEAFTHLAPVIAELALAIAPVLVDILEQLVPIFDQLAKFISENPEMVGKMIVGFIAMTAAISALMPVIEIITGLIAGGFGVVIVGAILAVVGWVVFLAAKFRWIRTVLASVIRGMIGHWRQLRDGIASQFVGIMGLILLNWDKIKRSASALMTWMRDKFSGLYEAITQPISDAVDWAGRKLGDLKDAVSGALDFLPGVGKESGGLIGAAGGGPRSGLTMVGEHGRELVRLAPGSQVHSNPDTERMLAGAGGGGGGVAQLEWVGGNAGDEFLAWLRKNIRVRGGNVQSVLGRA